MTPKKFLEAMLDRLEREHEKHFPMSRGSDPDIRNWRDFLMQAGYVTPRGHTHWWPAQVQQLSTDDLISITSDQSIRCPSNRTKSSFPMPQGDSRYGPNP